MHKGIKIIDQDTPITRAELKLQSPQQERPTFNGSEAKVAEPNKGGRPLKYSTPEKLQQAIDEFFEQEKFPTVSGLQYHLDMSRSTMADYKNREEFSNIIKRGTGKVAVGYEKKLVYGNGRNTAGIIFALKVGMGWKEPVAEERTNLDEETANTFSEKIAEVNRLYLKKAR